MTRETIDQRVLDKIKAEGFKPQTIRDGASRIKKKNHGLVTSNAAAYVWANNNGVNVYRYLSDVDKKSLQHLNVPQVKRELVGTRKIKTKSAEVQYGQKYITNANQNAEIYPHVFILENSLRDLILEKFKALGPSWWKDKKIIKEDISKHADYIQEQEKKHKWLGPRGNHPIYYVGLEHLYKIIEMNYNPHFRDIFELSKLKTWIDECVPIRNLLAHNIKTQEEERDNIRIRVKYICNLIEGHKK